jgi:hypothetical protein
MDMRKDTALALFMLVAVLTIPSFAAGPGMTAAGAGPQGTGPAAQTGYFLGARIQHLSCTIDFTTSVMNDVVNAVPQDSSALSADIAKLNGDEAQLSSLASAGNPDAFDSFVSGTLTPDVTQGISDLHAARRGFRGENVTNATLTQLNSGYNTAHSTLTSCNSGAVSTLLQARINQFSATINDWNSRISTLGAKGFDTTAMQGVASGATADVVTPLQNALQSGNEAQMITALQTYCLGDDCNGVNGSQPYDYHGFAHMALEVLQSEVDKAGTDPLAANLTAAGVSMNSSYLSDATQQLNSVRSTLTAVGTAKYAAGQEQSIDAGLRQASQDLIGYTHSIRQGLQQLRQQRMAERASQAGNYTGGRGFGGRYPGNFSGNATPPYPLRGPTPPNAGNQPQPVATGNQTQ